MCVGKTLVHHTNRLITLEWFKPQQNYATLLALKVDSEKFWRDRYNYINMKHS